jgi:hypothetical protein
MLTQHGNKSTMLRHSGTPRAFVFDSPRARLGNVAQKESTMLHLAISCSSYLLFFLVKVMTPAQQAAWRTSAINSRR